MCPPRTKVYDDPFGPIVYEPKRDVTLCDGKVLVNGKRVRILKFPGGLQIGCTFVGNDALAKLSNWSTGSDVLQEAE